MADQIDDFVVLKEWAHINVNEPDRIPTVPVLYHYTGPPGIYGIIASDCLWATAAQFSNDLSEFEYAISVSDAIIADTWKIDQTSNAREAFLANLVRKVLKAPFSRPYLACFCEDGNLLSQWRAYGRGAGFSIAFAPLLDGETLKLRSEHSLRVLLRKVDYESDSQRARLKALLTNLIQLVNQLPNPTTTSERTLLDSGITLITILEITDWACTVKDGAFHEEREWRLIVFPNLTSGGGDTNAESLDGVKVRATADLLIPYMELKATGNSGKLPIVGINCGPSRLQGQSAKAIRILLQKHGYSAPITSSSIPLRV
jgi:hypothetical protein